LVFGVCWLTGTVTWVVVFIGGDDANPPVEVSKPSISKKKNK